MNEMDRAVNGRSGSAEWFAGTHVGLELKGLGFIGVLSSTTAVGRTSPAVYRAVPQHPAKQASIRCSSLLGI